MSDQGRPKGQNVPMPWLRLWHSFLDNAKVRTVNDRVTNLNARATLEVRALRALYIDLLCVACRQDDSGRLPSLEQVAFLMRISEQEAQETIDKLVALKLIEKHGKCYWIHDWDQWQFSKSPAAIRQQKVRDKRNALRNASATQPVTRNDTEAQREAQPKAPRVRAQRERQEEEEESDSEGEKKRPSSFVRDSAPVVKIPDYRAETQAIIEAKRIAARREANGDH